MRPDDWIQSCPNLSKSCPKSSHSSFYLKIASFKITWKVSNYFGYFCKKICRQELSKIAQSGHTGPSSNRFKWRFILLSKLDGRCWQTQALMQTKFNNRSLKSAISFSSIESVFSRNFQKSNFHFKHLHNFRLHLRSGGKGEQIKNYKKSFF